MEQLRPKSIRDWLAALAVAAVYLCAAALGLSLAALAPQVSPVWPPTGIGLAAVLLLGNRVWPGIALGALIINGTASDAVLTACGIAVGNTLESLVGATLLRRCVSFRPKLDRPQDVLGLGFFGALVGPVIAASIGVTSLCLGGVQQWSQFAGLWWTWLLGDATGALVVTPAVLTWAECLRSRTLPRRMLESSLCLIAILIIGYVILVWPSTPATELKYLLFPFLMWSSLRLGQATTATAAVLVSALAVWGVFTEAATIPPESVNATLLLMQTFVGVLSLGSLTLGAVVAQRERIADFRRESEERLGAIFEQGIVGVTQVDLTGRFQQCNDRYCEIVGRSADELRHLRMQDITHPADLPDNVTQFERCIRDGTSFTIEKRYVRPDGRDIWVWNSVGLVRDSAGRPAYIVAVTQDISERKDGEQRQQRLPAELSHRVKNTLASVQSIVAQTAMYCPDPAEFRRSVESRLQALAQTHALLSRGDWSGAELADVVAAELRPHSTGGRAQAEGPRIYLRPKAALCLHLVMHELTTNAAKYGALSAAEGRVRVTWSVTPRNGDLQLHVHWGESGGPQVQTPRRRGFGTSVIEGSLAYELEAEAAVRFEPSGVCCDIAIPWRPEVGELLGDDGKRPQRPATPESIAI